MRTTATDALCVVGSRDGRGCLLVAAAATSSTTRAEHNAVFLQAPMAEINRVNERMAVPLPLFYFVASTAVAWTLDSPAGENVGVVRPGENVGKGRPSGLIAASSQSNLNQGCACLFLVRFHIVGPHV
jgi:hypothetical protein